MREDPEDQTFIENVKAALINVGFGEVFVDTDDKSGIHPGDHFEGRIYAAIADCDLFVPLIGPSWLSILQGRSTQVRQDILFREIRAAVKLEKECTDL